MTKAPKSSKNGGSASGRPPVSSPLPVRTTAPPGSALTQSLHILSQSANQASQERLDDDSISSTDGVAPSLPLPSIPLTSTLFPSSDPQLLASVTIADRISSPAPATSAKRVLRPKRARSPVKPDDAVAPLPKPPGLEVQSAPASSQEEHTVRREPSPSTADSVLQRTARLTRLIAMECDHYAAVCGGNILADERPRHLPDEDVHLCVLELIGRYHGYFPGAEISDGNCLFEALALAVFGASFHHDTIRKVLCDYATANPDRIRAFIAAEGRKCTVASWIAPYRRAGHWGQFVMILLFEEAFDCLVQVFSPDFFTYPSNGPPSFLMPHDPAEVALLRHRPRVSVWFNGSNHYIHLGSAEDSLLTLSETALLSTHRAAVSCRSPSDRPAWNPVVLPDLATRIRDSKPVPPRSHVQATFPVYTHPPQAAPSQPPLFPTSQEKPATFKSPTLGIPDTKETVTTLSSQRPLFSRASHLSPLFGVQAASEDLSRYVPYPDALWPPHPSDFSGFLPPPQMFGQGGNRVVALVRRAPVVNDYIVLPIDHTGTTSTHPWNWREFSEYALAAYRVATVSGSTIYAELPTLLLAPPTERVLELPPFIVLHGPVSWYIGAPAGLSVPAFSEDKDAHGVTLVLDSQGGSHQVSKHKNMQLLAPVECFQIIAGTGKFYLITQHCGNNLVHYTSGTFYDGVERIWLEEYVQENQSVLFPIIPYRTQCWYVAHLARTPGAPIDPGMLVFSWTFYHPWSGHINKGSRLCHFLAAGHPAVNADGSINSRESVFEALRGFASAAAVIFAAEYGRVIRSVVEQALDRQIALFLDPIYVEAKIIDLLAHFSDHFRNPDVPFHPIGSPDGTLVRGRELSVPVWAQFMQTAFLFVFRNMNPEEERQFLRQKELCFPGGWPGTPYGLSKPRREPTPTGTPSLVATATVPPKQPQSGSGKSASSQSPSTRQLLCFSDLLHSLKVPDARGQPHAACSDANCKLLHKSGIINSISYQRVERAAAIAPETRDPVVRAALLHKIRSDPKFADRPAGPARPKA